VVTTNLVFDINRRPAAASGRPTRSVQCQSRCFCDKTPPDLERVPSDLSDFCLYGGLYRHVNLALPAGRLALDMGSRFAYGGRWTGSAAGFGEGKTLQILQARNESCTVAIEVLDATGAAIHSTNRTSPAWTGFSELAAFTIPGPKLWSPDSPHRIAAG